MPLAAVLSRSQSDLLLWFFCGTRQHISLRSRQPPHKDVPLFLLAKVSRVVVQLIQRQTLKARDGQREREIERRVGETERQIYILLYRYLSLKYILYVTQRK